MKIGVDFMALGHLEKKIIDMIEKKEYDIIKVEELFKAGANPNALEDDRPEIHSDNEIYWSTFFIECLSSFYRKSPKFYQLLELFIKYGLDVNKYGASIISFLHFYVRISDIYKMTKLILDNMDKNSSVDIALSGIGIEESFLNCSFDDMDYESNDLYGLLALIEAFARQEPYSSIYRVPKKINEKFKRFYITGDFIALDKKKVTVKSERYETNMYSKIEMDKNTLIVKDNHSIYINNEDQKKYEDNIFTEYANEYFKNETIINFELRHYKIRIDPMTFTAGRVVTINFTNNKKLVYNEDNDNELSTLEIV